jgi:hypothetical protein
MFSFLRSLHMVCQSSYTSLHSTSSVLGSFFPASLPIFVVGGVLHASYSKRNEVESYCGFDLHFLHGKGW